MKWIKKFILIIDYLSYDVLPRLIDLALVNIFVWIQLTPSLLIMITLYQIKIGIIIKRAKTIPLI